MSNKDTNSKIFLIPTFLAEDNTPEILAPVIKEVVSKVNYFFVEEVRTARRFISKLKTGRVIDELHFFVLNKDTQEEDVQKFFKEIPQGEDIGILSEAGCPGIADPGAVAVRLGHRLNKVIVPLPGPSSILLALMASGFSGQKFRFNGYLSLDKAQRTKQIKTLEREAQGGTTEIFMETPYRNNSLLEELFRELNDKTSLCIACNITAADEFIKSLSIGEWKKIKPDLNKKPTIFLLG